jgi:hypothetical protein
LKIYGLTDREELNLPKLRLLNNIESVLNQIVGMVHRHVSCNDHTAVAVALWIVFTWCIKYAKYAPIFYITAPEMRCGKTELLEFIGELCMNPEAATGHTPATLFHIMNKNQPTVLMDEADEFLNKDGQLVAMINKGYQRKGAYIPRMATGNKSVIKYSIWGAKAIAGIGLPKATIKDRSIVGALQRKLVSDKKMLVSEADGAEFIEVKQKIKHWVKAKAKALKHTKPAYLKELNDRANNSWSMLLVIADLASPEWGVKARLAAIAISGEDDEMSLNQELLADIQRVFQASTSDKLSTKELVKGLLSLEDSRWKKYKGGQALTNIALLALLKPFGLRTKSVRGLDGIPTSGFAFNDFMDIIARYLPTDLQASDSSD